MNRRDVRERLQKWAKAKEEISAWFSMLKTISDEIDEEADILRAQALDGLPKAQNVGNPTESAAIRKIGLAERYEERIAKINAEIDRLEAIRDEIDLAMIFLGDRETAVIRMKYADCMTYEEIADALGCTDRNVRYLESKAVDEIAENLKEGL